ncbi:hypothetical protein [Pontibacter qinzhouensis]|uniref:hypothetical protein n=1 Tax=Pontibacter qinzhouensis TaxID=2603253 RepID=UPI00164FB07D|nr:hypothetical protein [Pontibacter qinzhouensis]
MKFFLQENPFLNQQELLRWTQLRHAQLVDAIQVTKDTIWGFVKRQAAKGNWKEVEEVLKGKPMSETALFLGKELKDRVVQNLILRLGLRSIIAVSLAIVLLPFILAKLSGSIISYMKEAKKANGLAGAEGGAVSDQIIQMK